MGCHADPHPRSRFQYEHIYCHPSCEVAASQLNIVLENGLLGAMKAYQGRPIVMLLLIVCVTAADVAPDAIAARIKPVVASDVAPPRWPETFTLA